MEHGDGRTEEKQKVKGATSNFMSVLNLKSPSKSEKKPMSTRLLLGVCFRHGR